MDGFIQKLRDHRLSVTPQRLAVLSWLDDRYDHPTAEQIYQGVRKHLPAISFNTIYKTLEVLCEKGLVIKVNPLHDVARYDIRTYHHAHLVCRSCHAIVDLDWGPFSTPDIPAEALQGFEVDGQSVIFWGKCPQCQDISDKQEE